MNAGRRSQLVTFEKRIITEVAGGGYTETWSTSSATGTFTEWAEVIWSNELTATFTLLYRKAPDGTDITTTSHRIVWNGRRWSFASAGIDPTRRRDLIITSDSSTLIEVTHLRSTEKEYIEALPVLRPED